MTLKTLKRRALFVLAVAIFLAMLVGFSDGAVALLPLVAAIGGFALLMWLAAIVADATVQTLKKEH